MYFIFAALRLGHGDSTRGVPGTNRPSAQFCEQKLCGTNHFVPERSMTAVFESQALATPTFGSDARLLKCVS
jgi:hypothetical protein